MQWVRANRRVWTWVAAFAILWISAAPAISHAVQARAGGVGIEICSSLGAKFVSVADLENPQPTAPSSLIHSLDHCPYCTAHLGVAAPPSAALSVVLLPLHFAAPQPLHEAAHTPRAWHHAPSRAPPPIA